LSVSSRTENKEDLDSLITSLIGDGKKHQPTLSVSTTRSKDDVYSPTPSTPAAGGQVETLAPAPLQALSEAPKVLTFAPLTTVYEIVAETPKQEVVTYSKGVQTEDAFGGDDDNTRTYFDDNDMTNKQDQHKREEELRRQLQHEIEQEVQAAHKAQADADAARQLKEEQGVKMLREDESSALLESDDFIDFLERSSKIAERALDEDYNVLADYKLAEQENENKGMGRGRTGKGLRELVQFYDERWSKKRMITDLDFSPKVC